MPYLNLNLEKEFLAEKKKLESDDKTLAKNANTVKKISQLIEDYKKRPTQANPASSPSEYSNLVF